MYCACGCNGICDIVKSDVGKRDRVEMSYKEVKLCGLVESHFDVCFTSTGGTKSNVGA